METKNYRKWIPALIIALVLCLPVIAWLVGGTSEHGHPAADEARNASQGGCGGGAEGQTGIRD